MSDNNVLIIGDGPGGLSAALFLAKNGVDADVFGVDGTPMHKAMLYNYLGIEEMTGSDFQQIARSQVEKFGGELHDEKVSDIENHSDRFEVETESGSIYQGDYIIVAASNKSFFSALELETEDGVAVVDRDCRTNVEDAYAVGWATRNQKIQAIISAGDGGAAALDILSKEKGEPYHDFDVVE